MTSQYFVKGFTLLELMVSVAVLAILLAIGVPGFRYFIDSSQLRAASEGLKLSVGLARTEAVTRGGLVTLCRANTAGTACDNNNDWSHGWLVLPNGGDPVRVWDSLPSGYTLTVSGATQSIVFGPEGTVQGETPYEFTLSGSEKRCFSVNAIGAFTAEGC